MNNPTTFEQTHDTEGENAPDASLPSTPPSATQVLGMHSARQILSDFAWTLGKVRAARFTCEIEFERHLEDEV